MSQYTSKHAFIMVNQHLSKLFMGGYSVYLYDFKFEVTKVELFFYLFVVILFACLFVWLEFGSGYVILIGKYTVDLMC